MKIIVVLHNIRSAHNVGSIMRTAEGLGISSVVLSGYTPRFHDERLLPHIRSKIDREIHKTALFAEEMIEITNADDIETYLIGLKKDGWTIVGLENNIEDERLYLLNDRRLKTALGDKVAMIVGEEVEGIDKALYDLIEVFLEIPMKGKKESFNVSVATGIAAYGIMNL